jgi:hypothetical protein
MSKTKNANDAELTVAEEGKPDIKSEGAVDNAGVTGAESLVPDGYVKMKNRACTTFAPAAQVAEYRRKGWVECT